jgi:lipoate-protein ligase A
VCNISEVLPNMSFKEFRKHLATSLKKQFNVVNDFDFTDEIKVEVDNLVKEKYSKWEWNFGYSPSYTLNKSIYNDGNEVDIKITVKKGLIEKVETENEISETLRKQLNFFEGKSHKIEIIKGICESYGYVDYLDFF